MKSRSKPWLSLTVVEAAARAASARGVSSQARGSGGFVRAYKAANGRASALGDHKSGQSWRDRRDGFVARHTAQMRGKESSWERMADGTERPTRRHLALAVWAYSPDAKRLRAWLKREGYLSGVRGGGRKRERERRRNGSNGSDATKLTRPNPASTSLPVLAVDDGPNGAAVLANANRVLGVWAWSFDDDSKGGQVILRDVRAAGRAAGRKRPKLYHFDTLDDVGAFIATEAARRARTPDGRFRIVAESVWGGALSEGSVVPGIERTAPRSVSSSRVSQRMWVRDLLGLSNEEAQREGRVYREMQARAKRVKLPAGLEGNRHVWDALGIALWALGERASKG